MWHLLHGVKSLPKKYNPARHRNAFFYHYSEELDDELQPSKWYERAYPKLVKSAHILKNVDRIDGRLTNIEDCSTFIDDQIDQEMQTFKSLARAFIGAPSLQQALRKATSSAPAIPNACFGKPNERESLTLNSLTKVCDFLNVSAQQRKSVRLRICPQVTQHHIWRGVLEEILNNLKSEMGALHCHPLTARLQMGDQIISSCVCFLAESAYSSSESDSPSWMRLASTRVADSPPSRKWGDILEMFDDLIKCLRPEKRLTDHVTKLEAMREGLYQIKEVLVERDIGYREARHQERLVQKKLTQTLGHSSKCLFTLLLYYLYGSVRDVEVEVCGGVYGRGSGSFCLCIGKVLTSDGEKMLWNGIKQLDRALGLFKFVWESAGMKGMLELQGHVWCMRAEERTLTYRGNVFFVHGIKF
ncbi:uncharacterized protein LOC131224159 [Magnolia sinica]|uniref:uncharacterized protein LOC131223222 n=1 Tax=Magnolia sinica TaxID=86752 RepID=UPI002657BB4D|nr:uncharacterized protein LOC131223222 [Magnolia sinica]XP_058074530.1 uncharacterized protein LOC131223222 [Magnolia sinica]XP_058074531.1 uncharacterized protein LOC131223222 [Magnolia sinica]XP_058075685.1 uncharacterized protein LOC131224159 [Magnolia sinica]